MNREVAKILSSSTMLCTDWKFTDAVSEMSDAYSPFLPSLLTPLELPEWAGCGAKFVGRNSRTHCHACYRYSKSNPDAPRRDPDADRHGDSEAATSATAWLLLQRTR
jgi:hypothetical protein